jgi:hypothetical protein
MFFEKKEIPKGIPLEIIRSQKGGLYYSPKADGINIYNEHVFIPSASYQQLCLDKFAVLDKTTERKYRITGYPQRREYLLSSSG